MKQYRFKIRLLPVVTFTAIVLLLLKAHEYTPDIGHMENVPISGDMKLWDIFCYVKSSAILFITVWAALTMGYLLITGQIKLKRNKIYIPMMVYTVGVLISHLLSDYPKLAWIGGIDRFEGTRTLLCYMFMLFYTINVVDDALDVITILIPTLCGVLIACCIGLTQLVGHDIWGTEVGRILIAGNEMIQTNFKPGQVYQTVYNMNYVGMYLALVIPLIILVLSMSYKACKFHRAYQYHLNNHQLITIIILSVALLLLIALNVYGANSVGGIIGVIASVMILLIGNLQKKWQMILLSVISVIGLGGVLLILYITGTDHHTCIDYFITDMDSVTTSIDGTELSIHYISGDQSYELRDCDGAVLSVSASPEKDGFYIPNDERYHNKLALGFWKEAEEHIIEMDIDDTAFIFRFDQEKGALYRNPFGEEVRLKKVPHIGFNGHLTAGNGRGYIWSRTIPLLKKNILIGSGADTFFMEFPHDDYAGKYSSITPLYTTFDKPHSLYLQMMQGTGGVSLIAFLIIIGMYLNQVIRNNNSKMQPASIAIAAGIIGFLIAGTVNDSSVCIMPLFYGMLGMGIALSSDNKKSPA